MRSTDNIRKTIKNTKIKTNPEVSKAVLNDLLDQMDRAEGIKTNAHQSNTWRLIMNNKMTKFATAAVIVIGLGMAVNLIDRAATPVWAIEQSIEAMKNYRGMRYSGTISISWKDFFKEQGVEDLPELPESLGEFEMWAQADEELSRSSATKIMCQDNIIILGNKLQTYVQLADGTTYDIQGDMMKIDPWPTSKLLRHLKDNTSTWTELYGMNAETGKERIFVKGGEPENNRSWEIEFDAESKLLISIKQWNRSDSHEGEPNINIWKIVYYEELPDDIFEIDLPDSSKIIAVNTPLNDPEYGMDAEGLTQEQACYKIIEELWQAMYEQDLDKIRKLIPMTAKWSDEILISNLGLNDGPSELLEMGQIYESKIGPVVPCTIQAKDKQMIIDWIVMFREIDGSSSCVIYSNKGQPRPVE
ncbi:MAG TPA: hypothetical protein ENH94_10670 [Phycisphaerales bacterium]|nr:hypothetical protein [Phycisphaerales bacterium]